MRKRSVCTILAVSMLALLVACGGAAKGNDPAPFDVRDRKGGYVETAVTLHGARPTGLYAMGESGLFASGSDFSRCWASFDGGLSWAEDERLAGYRVQAVGCGPDGTTMALLKSGELLVIRPDGEKATIALEGYTGEVPEGRGELVVGFTVLSGERLLVQWYAKDYSTANSVLYAATGERLGELGSVQSVFTASDDTIYELESYRGYINSYSLADGAVLEWGRLAFPPVGYKTTGGMNAALAYRNGVLLCASGLGVYGAVLEEGEEVVRYVPEYATALAVEGCNVNGMVLLADGTIVVAAGPVSGPELYRYSWDKSFELDDSRVLRVWSLFKDENVRLAINELRRTQPNIIVEHEIASYSASGANWLGDALTTLNTQLLAGSGPDVVILDGVDIGQYAGRGLLRELDDLVDRGAIWPNLLENMPYSGFILPTGLEVPVLATRNGLVFDGFGDLLDYVAQADGPGETLARYRAIGEMVEGPADEEERFSVPMWSGSPAQLFDTLWAVNAPALVEGGELQTDVLAALFEAGMVWVEAYDVGQADHYGLGKGVNHMYLDADEMFFMLEYSDVSALYLSGPEKVLLLYYNTLSEWPEFEREDVAISLFPGLAPGVWKPVSVAAVAAATQKEALAGVFLETLLSRPVQGSVGHVGLPVTQNSYGDMTANYSALGGLSRAAGYDFTYLIEGLTTPDLVDGQLRQWVREAFIAYCRGEVSLEAAVDEVVARSALYFAERQ